MTSILVQKHPLKGSREFQIIDDELQCSIQSPFKKETFNVALDILEAEPVTSGSTLSFISKVNKEPLVEMFLNQPEKETFITFVSQLRQKIIDNDFGRLRVSEEGVEVNIERLNESIEMLQKNIDPTEIEDFLSALVELKAKPDDIQCQNNVVDAFNQLGFAQSQVILYAPYINFMFSRNRLVGKL